MASSSSDRTDKDLLIDADKAVDEAKYEATTQLDNTVLRALQMAVISLKYKMQLDVLDPEWKKNSDRVFQCTTEATYYITPDRLTEMGRQQAQKETCNKETSEWGAGITK